MKLNPQQPITTSIEIVNEDFEAVQGATLQSKAARDAWQQKTDFFRPEGEWGAWVTQLKVTPNLGFGLERYVENPIRVPAQAQVHGFFLVRNAWKEPHDLRLVLLLDFQQMAVVKAGEVHDFYDLIAMEPQKDHAFEFVLPALSEGFHQFSVLLVTDPHSLSTDTNYRFTQKASFHEERFDLWVGLETPPEDVTTFENTKLGQAAASRVSSLSLIASPDVKENKPLLSLTLKPAETYCLNLRLFNCGTECLKESEANALYTEPVPLRIAVFWDDKLERVLDYDLLSTAPDNLTLELEIKAPVERGTHQLGLTAFTFPDYSQFTLSKIERTGYPGGIFSQRIPVNVQP